MKTTRRDFIKTTGVGAAAVAGLKISGQTPSDRNRNSEIPPHRAIDLDGLHAYADQISVAAGESIDFHVSSSVPYQMSIVKLGHRIDEIDGDEVIHEFSQSLPLPQSIHPGSYVLISDGIKSGPLEREFSMECWLRPWSFGRLQGILTQYEEPSHCGFGIFCDEEGRLAVYLGQGKEPLEDHWHVGPALVARKWHHVVVTWDGDQVSLWLDAEPVGHWSGPSRFNPGRAVLRLGAYQRNGVADGFLDGDLAQPCIYSKVLSREEIVEHHRSQGLSKPKGETFLACWPLDEEVGDEIRNAGRNALHGRLINRGTWMIGGPSFDGENVDRYKAYDPGRDDRRGNGLRLSSDDLYDCRWRPTHSFPIPDNTRSGIYTARFRFELNGKSQLYDVTFIVRKHKARPKAQVVVLCSTNTWLAYNGTPFAVNDTDNRHWGTNGQKNPASNPPAYNFYRDHHAGQPTYQMGVRMPWPAAGPYVLYSPDEVGYSHLMRAERFTHVWLEENGYSYDVITDWDLHQNPDLLNGYQAMVINGHSEYWSREAYSGVDNYLKQGGNALVLSGNTMFWRVSYDPDGSVVECRKFQPDIGGRGAAVIGEIYHSHDRQRGSLMRHCGLPAWKIIGLECIGWWGTGKKEDFGVYQVTASSHDLFHEPYESDLKDGDKLGMAAGGGLPRAGGHEADVRLSTLAGMNGNIPDGHELASEPSGIETLAAIYRKGQRGLNYYTHWTQASDGIITEMIFWSRPQGGLVFHAGAIGSGWALSEDPQLGMVVKNVLHRFGIQPA